LENTKISEKLYDKKKKDDWWKYTGTFINIHLNYVTKSTYRKQCSYFRQRLS
jgi:hypothetical protein